MGRLTKTQILTQLLGKTYTEADRKTKRAFKMAYKYGGLHLQPQSYNAFNRMITKSMSLYECGTPLYMTTKGFEYFSGSRMDNEDNSGFLLFGRHHLLAFVAYHSGEITFLGTKSNIEDNVTLCSLLYQDAGIFSTEPYQVFPGITMPAEGYAAQVIDSFAALKENQKDAI